MRSATRLTAVLLLALTPPLAPAFGVTRGVFAQDSLATPDCDASLGPLGLVNDGPFRQPFLRARPQRACPARLPQVAVQVGIANQFVDAEQATRRVFLDAETYRIDLGASLPLGERREIRVDVPLHVRSTGILDAPIEGWHMLLGLPEGTRRDHRRNQVRLIVADSSSADVQYLVAQLGPGAGFGDVTLSFLQQLTSSAGSPAAAVRAAVKLPTGSSGELFGSGALDFGAGLGLTALVAERLWLHGNLDLVATGSSSIAGSTLPQTGLTSHLMMGLEWRIGATTHLLAQISSESAPLDVGISELDRPSLLLAVGARRALSRQLEAELGIGEDLRVETAPDFALQVGMRWTAR